MNILVYFDIVIFALMGLIIARAYFKGFSGMLLSVASFIISAAAAWFLYPALAQSLDNGKLPYTVMCGISIVVIYVLSMAVCCVASFVFNLFFKLPVLKTANKLIGLLLGVVCALLFAKIAAKAVVLIYENAELGNAWDSLIVKIFN